MPLRVPVHALRSLRRSPAFTATAVVTIALGIGASTAIFSVANAVLLRPLPYKDADRLIFAISDLTRRDVKDFPLSNADFIDLRNGTTSAFEELGAVATGRGTLPREDGTLEQVRNAGVSAGFFRMMGARVALGRDFTDQDGLPQPPAPAAGGEANPAPARLPNVVILSHQYWLRRFGGNPSVIGKPLPGAQPGASVIAGVLEPGFELLFPPDANIERSPDVWFAARINYDPAARNNVAWRVIGRLKEGVSMRHAQSQVDRVAAELRKISTISQTAGFALRLEPMHQHVVQAVRPAIVALMGAVIFLLLIACSNVANLLLVRASLRERDLAVRTALGGNWWRLVSQTLWEALVLAAGGAVLGVGLAGIAIQQLRAIAPENLPRLETIGIDWVVLAFACFSAFAAAAIFGLAPAIRALRPDVAQVLRANGRSSGLAGGGVLRNGVVIAEAALSFVLLVGSGLMFRSFLELQRIQPGYDPEGLLTFQLLGGGRLPKPEERAAFQREILDRLRSVPGVQSVTAATPFPLTGGFSPLRWGLEPALTDPTRFQACDFQIVLPGYFEAMRTPVIAGRTFSEADNAPDRRVVVIDQQLAAKAFPLESAVGRRILTRIRTPEPEWVEVIGVVAHQRAASLAEPGREQIYFTDGFLQHGIAGRWAVRTRGDPGSLAGPVRAEINKMGGRLVLEEMRPMPVLVAEAQAGTRFSLLLIGVFAAVAALLAGVGLYGVLSTLVRQRTAEIGVRMALGAQPSGIFRLVVIHGLRLSGAGVGIGLLAALGLTHAMSGMLVGVKPTDPATYAAMAALFLAITTVAGWLPARRAAALHPTAALREE